MGKAEYPDHKDIIISIQKFTDKIIEIDAKKIAIEAGSSRSLNMVMFGGIIGTGIAPISKDSALQAISEAFPKKFEKINLSAAEIGFEQVRKKL
ncbi:MAG: 2-oxoacid:acceptor oxidoreductase family protein [Candidatus Thorarchaeota archaeon]|nr:2-oxoacid:acceptor oxidoreductase family protein [Candidatus Thorarchaeota archaeon]